MLTCGTKNLPLCIFKFLTFVGRVKGRLNGLYVNGNQSVKKDCFTKQVRTWERVNTERGKRVGICGGYTFRTAFVSGHHVPAACSAASDILCFTKSTGSRKAKHTTLRLFQGTRKYPNHKLLHDGWPSAQIKTEIKLLGGGLKLFCHRYFLAANSNLKIA